MARRVGDALRGARGRLRPRVEFVPASRLPGAELMRLGGGEVVATPAVPGLPTDESAAARGLAGASLALPPAAVRVLRDVHLCVGENVVRTPDGAVVAEGANPERLDGLRRRHLGAPVIEAEGTAALHGLPVLGTFEALVESFAPVLLLQHPALHALAPVTVLSAGPTTLVEGFLLDRLTNRQVTLQVIAAGTAVRPTRTLLPSPVTRTGAGAIPGWYRRWLDQQAGAVDIAPAAPRLLLAHGPDDPGLRRPEVREVAEAAGLVTLDTLTGAISGDGTLGADELVSTLRDASLVVGASDDALGHALFSRRAEILQVATASTVTPRVAQLAASRALPYRFLRPAELEPALAPG